MPIPMRMASDIPVTNGNSWGRTNKYSDDTMAITRTGNATCSRVTGNRSERRPPSPAENKNANSTTAIVYSGWPSSNPNF